MKAAVVITPDRPPQLREIEPPQPTGGSVVASMHAAALSPRTRSGAAGTHYTSDADAPPVIAGIDGVGTLPDGRRAYVLALDGRMGTMAEQCLVDPRRCVPVPDGATSEAVAGGMIAGISSWAALTLRTAFRPGQEVLVLGATGTAGTLAVQIARAFGAGRVVAAGRDPGRLAALADQGADAVVPLTGSPDEVADALVEQARTVDVVLDYLWGPVTEHALTTLLRARPHADQPLHWVELGSMAGPTITLPSAALRSRDLRLIGSGQGSVGGAALLALMPELMATIADGTVVVDTIAVPLDEVETRWDAPDPAGRRLVFTI
ncbi:MAG TPA: zinc-binding alcohol dehydrogenase family protein [Iamia sp.]|jgi:NADPH:quinone reductase-like Zn-dependent oxidoreductase|nr:zinc-binding alcohol dehydrogenase family protein [Iamia sp.]